jgi:RNA polymerase sigma-70 factor, ECF subfamily
MAQITIRSTAGAEGEVPAPASPPESSSIAGTETLISAVEAEIPRLRRFARSMVRDSAQADDLVQECLERALSRTHLWKPGTNLRAWLFTILRNLHINAIRRRQNLVDIDGEGCGGIGAVPGAQIDRLELRDLRRALQRLPAEQRQVVLLVGLEGSSYGEAAETLGISIGTVKSRLSRGRRVLRAMMDGRAPGEAALT